MRIRLAKLLGLRRLGGEFAWVLAGQAGAVLGSLVGLRIITDALGPAEFGRLALALTISSLLGLTVFAGPGAATLRFFSAAREKGELAALIHGAHQLVRQRTVLVALAGAVAALPIWAYAGPAWLNLSIAALVQAVFASFAAILDGAQNAARQRKIVAFHTGLSNWLRPASALGLFALAGQSAAVTLWGYALATGLVCCSQFLFFRRDFQNAFDGLPTAESTLSHSWASQISAYALPYSLWGLPYWLHTASERWALEQFADTRAVGLYAVVGQLGYGLVTMLSALVLQLVSPIIYHRAGDGLTPLRLRDAHRTTSLVVAGFLGLMTITALAAGIFHPFVFSLLVSREFQSVSYLWPLSVLSGGAFACGQLLAVSLSSGVSTAPLLAPKVGSAIIGLALTVIGARQAGVPGVVWASLASSLLYFGWMAILARSDYRRNAGAVLAASYGHEGVVT
jgi:O-antigen/teichoic acid export membrane protein